MANEFLSYILSDALILESRLDSPYMFDAGANANIRCGANAPNAYYGVRVWVTAASSALMEEAALKHLNAVAPFKGDGERPPHNPLRAGVIFGSKLLANDNSAVVGSGMIFPENGGTIYRAKYKCVTAKGRVVPAPQPIDIYHKPLDPSLVGRGSLVTLLVTLFPSMSAQTKENGLTMRLEEIGVTKLESGPRCTSFFGTPAVESS